MSVAEFYHPDVLPLREKVEIEASVAALLRDAKEPDDVAPVLERVALHMGVPVHLAHMRSEGRAQFEAGGWNVYIRHDLHLGPKGFSRYGRFVLGHEIAHVYALRVLRREVSESWCDAFGLALAAPRRAVERVRGIVTARRGSIVRSVAYACLVTPDAAKRRVRDVRVIGKAGGDHAPTS